MKKHILLILTLLFMSACAASEKPSDTYILFVTPLFNHPIWQEAKVGFESACEDYKIHCDWVGPEYINIPEMEHNIFQGIQKKADGIITQGIVSKDIMDYAEKEGIPMILIEDTVEDAHYYRVVRKDYEKQASLIAQDIFSQHPEGNVKVAIQVARQDFVLAQTQIKAMKDALSQGPGVNEVVAISESFSDKFSSRDSWRNVLETQDDLDVLINFTAESAIEAVHYLELKPYSRELLIYAVDDLKETMDYIDSGAIRATIVTSFYSYGYDSVKELLEYKDNPDIESGLHCIIPIELVKNEGQ